MPHEASGQVPPRSHRQRKSSRPGAAEGRVIAREGIIVVGAGSGGGVAAARLSEDPELDVLVLEGGPDYPEKDDLPAPLLDVHNPAPGLAGHDWGFQASFVEPPEERPPGPYPRGRVMGGTSSINASIGQRGTPSDFDGWAALGNDRWAWDQVLPYYLQIERDLDYGDRVYHSDDGPVPIARTPFEQMPPSMQAFEKACLERGFPPCPDHNEPNSVGVGTLPRNQDGDLRASTLMTYLKAARDRENLTLIPNARVRRILFDDNRAVGVEASVDGKIDAFEAGRVVLSAGTISSPTILMHSGIGPAETLSRFGIDVVSTLEGVGRNFHDHPLTPAIATIADDAPPKCGLLTALKYSSDGAGGAIDLLITPALLETRSLTFPLPTDASTVLVVAAVLAKPRSKGWMTIESNDPELPPEIRLNYLSAGEDVEATKLGLRLIRDLLTTSPMKSEVGTILFPDAETVDDDAKLEGFIRQAINTGFHAAGTCRMGPADDEQAVVDQDLAVHGVEGLYVADASIMPDITTGFTNLTCYMIGERLADNLRTLSAAQAKSQVAW